MDIVNRLCGPHVNPLTSGDNFDEITRLQQLCWEAVDEIRRLRAEREWQPIKTAPRDGTIIYGESWKTAQRGLIYFNSEGEWELINGMNNLPMGIGFYPTNWMHVPELPSHRPDGQPGKDGNK